MAKAKKVDNAEGSNPHVLKYVDDTTGEKVVASFPTHGHMDTIKHHLNARHIPYEYEGPGDGNSEETEAE